MKKIICVGALVAVVAVAEASRSSQAKQFQHLGDPPPVCPPICRITR
jgi:hypothetical protein